MPNVEILDAKRIVVQTTWNEKDLVKAIPGSAWDSDARQWTVPLTYTACVQLKGQFGDNLQVGEKLTKWIWDEFNSRVKPSLTLRSQIEDVGGGLHIHPNLYPFQTIGAAWLITTGSGVLADEMGTGKTIQALAAMQHIESLPALIICPNSVKAHWAKEAAKWLPESTPYVVTGSAVDRTKILHTAAQDPTALVIVNFEALMRLSRLAGFGSMRLVRCTGCDPKDGVPNLRPTACEVHPRALNQIDFKLIIVDEAHRIKDPKAKQTRAVWALGSASSVVRRWALTGTPLANDPSDLWSIMHFVAPPEYPTKSKFVDLYCLQAWNNFGGLDVVGLNPHRRDEFYRFFDPRFRRMPKALVLTHLPPKIRSIRTVEMTPKQKKAYNELASQLVTTLDDGSILVSPNNLSAQVRLLQLSSSYCTIETGSDPNDLTQWTVELCEPSPKLDELMVILDELGDKQCVVAAESRRLIELAAARLGKAGISYGLITGKIDEWDRRVSLDDFQDGKLRVLLFTVKAGGVGLTMTASDTIVFLQRSWSMIDNKQAEDRVHRIGSEIHDSVHIIELMTTGTVEEVQLLRLQEKMRRLDEINRDRATLKLAGKDASHLDAIENAILDSNLGVPE